jgi:hypothetical protein
MIKLYYSEHDTGIETVICGYPELKDAVTWTMIPIHDPKTYYPVARLLFGGLVIIESPNIDSKLTPVHEWLETQRKLEFLEEL